MAHTKTLGDIGACVNHVIRQGATFGPWQLTILNPKDTVTVPTPPQLPIDVTGKVFRAQMRKKGRDATITATLDVTVINATAGRVDYGLTAAATALLECGERIEDRASQYVWDLEMEDPVSGVITPLLYGDISVFREVTR
jgi:hypothetical protein